MANVNGIVRLTYDAIDDLRELAKKDPHVVRVMAKKMIVLTRSPHAGEPLLGNLTGFRKIKVGNRHYRIVWRVVEEADSSPVIEIAEIWSAGPREDAKVYRALGERLRKYRLQQPETVALNEVAELIGLTLKINVATDDSPAIPPLPAWLQLALKDQLKLPDSQIESLTEPEAKKLLADYWSRS